MSVSQLEQRVRLLPSVRSCAVDEQRVTVLVDDSTDRRNVAAGVAYILADLDMERKVHVLGGIAAAAEVLPGPRRRSVWLVLAGILAVVCIALGLVQLTDNRSRSDPPDRARPRPSQATTPLPTSSPTAPPATFPPEWELRPGP